MLTGTGGAAIAGSSPLARRPQQLTLSHGNALGIIPARAGNTVQAPEAPTGRTNHPRSHGEHLVPQSILKIWLGSSPLMRGTYQSDTAGPVVARLIPARAGNTCHVRAPRAHAWAHPRSRGEHSRSEISRSRVRGSSPLARGPRQHELTLWRIRGLIPARAGTTWDSPPAVCPCRAHPRSRGDHRRMRFGSGGTGGSSPLARGTLGVSSGARLVIGLIPARAGNTYEPGFQFVPCWAHPRSRGEHSSSTGKITLTLGSSPLARGTPGN